MSSDIHTIPGTGSSIDSFGISRRRVLQITAAGALLGAVKPVAAEEQTANLHGGIGTTFEHIVNANNFESHEVPAEPFWFTFMDTNWSDVPVRNPVLELETDLDLEELPPSFRFNGRPIGSTKEFQYVDPQLVERGPPVYRWTMDDLALKSDTAVAGEAGLSVASTGKTVTTPVTPPVDVHRSIDAQEFAEPGIQTLELTITPDPDVDWLVPAFNVGVYVSVDGEASIDIEPPANTTNNSYATTGDHGIFWLQYEDGEPLASEYTFRVPIHVHPGSKPVRVTPIVRVLTFQSWETVGPTTGSGKSYDVDGLGTLTWSADGDVTWPGDDITFAAVTLGEPNHPPEITAASVDPAELWSPNNKPRDVTVAVDAKDPDGDIVEITYVVDDEYDEFNEVVTQSFDGEAEIHAEQVLSLEASRNGSDRDGRTYTIGVTVTDKVGLDVTTSVTVTVPHDQR